MKSFQTLINPTLDNKPYRLRCRFKIEPCPRSGLARERWFVRLLRERVRVAEMFVSDMHKQSWEHDSRFGFKMTGPFPCVAPVQLSVPPALKAREMAALVAKGERFLDFGRDTASLVPELNCTEWWEFELAGVFIRPQIMTEIPDLHEEMN